MRSHDTVLIESLLADSCLIFLEETEDIAKAETQAMEFTLKRLAAAFGEALCEMDSELEDEIPRTWRVKEHVSRHPLAEFGRIEYTQTVYVDEAGESCRYLDEVIGMPARVRMTPNMAGMLAENATSTSYANASDIISAIVGSV